MDTILVLLNLFLAWLEGNLSHNFPKLWSKKILETWDIHWEISLNKKKTKVKRTSGSDSLTGHSFVLMAPIFEHELDICVGWTGQIRHYYFLSNNKCFINVTFSTILCGGNYDTGIFHIMLFFGFFKHGFFLWKYTHNKVVSAFQSEVRHIPLTVQWRIFFWFLILCWTLEMPTLETILELELKV